MGDQMNDQFDRRYLDLLIDRKELQAKIDLVKWREQASVLNQIIHQMEVYGISLDEVGMALYASRCRENKKKMRRPPKYLDPKSGKTWAGVGKMPTWLRGKNLEDYRLPMANE